MQICFEGQNTRVLRFLVTRKCLVQDFPCSSDTLHIEPYWWRSLECSHFCMSPYYTELEMFYPSNSRPDFPGSFNSGIFSESAQRLALIVSIVSMIDVVLTEWVFGDLFPLNGAIEPGWQCFSIHVFDILVDERVFGVCIGWVNELSYVLVYRIASLDCVQLQWKCLVA